MAALNAARRFAIIADALTHAEEEGGVSLVGLATTHAITLATLKDVLAPILYLEFRDAAGDLVDGTHAYLVTESDYLTVTEQHWLGVARSKAPDPEHALRMMIAAMIAKTGGHARCDGSSSARNGSPACQARIIITVITRKAISARKGMVRKPNQLIQITVQGTPT